MTTSTPDFDVAVQGVAGLCPAGEAYVERNRAEQNTPVLSCEGGCIRGEIARLAATYVAQEIPGLARACHAETFFVPHSAMTRWVKEAERAIMIDGCFLRCHGRVLDNIVDPGKVRHIDANVLHHKYTEVFLIEDVPEEERKATARDVADQIVKMLTDQTSQQAS